MKRASLYKLEDAVTYVGKILHDFAGLDPSQGILNNVTIRIEFQISQDSWKLMCPAGDITEKYKLQIVDCKLHCAVASCTDATWSAITRQLENNDATYHFRRVEIVGHPIAKASKTFMSDSLFPQNVLPSKIIIGNCIFCFLLLYFKLANIKYTFNHYSFSIFQHFWKQIDFLAVTH